MYSLSASIQVNKVQPALKRLAAGYVLVRAILPLLLLCLLSACGIAPSPSPLPSPAALQVASPPPWPACAPVVTGSPAIPPAVAPGFPFPPALALTKALVLHNDPNHQEFVGYAPLGLADSIRWLRDQLPPAGYIAAQTDGEPDEIEGALSGNGWYGNYWVRPEMTCRAVTEWVLIFQKR